MTNTDIKELVEQIHRSTLMNASIAPNLSSLANKAAEALTSLSSENERMRGALEEIAKPTYGTDFCNTQEENNAILAPHVFWYQNIARAALGKDTPDAK